MAMSKIGRIYIPGGKIKAALARHPVVHSVVTNLLVTGTLNLQRARTQPSVSAPSLKS